MRKAMIVAALLALIASVVPNGAQASHHCWDIFILSGTNAATGPSGEKLGGVNLGSATCTVTRNSPDLPNVNVLTPGATHLWVGVGYTNHPADDGAPSGTIKVGSAAATALTGWKKNDLRSRWESGYLAVTSATTYTATVTVSTPSFGRSATQSVTYTKAA